MTVSWHCRGCNEKGIQSFTTEEILKFRKKIKGGIIFDVLMALVSHECKSRDIGIRLSRGDENVGDVEVKES